MRVCPIDVLVLVFPHCFFTSLILVPALIGQNVLACRRRYFYAAFFRAFSSPLLVFRAHRGVNAVKRYWKFAFYAARLINSIHQHVFSCVRHFSVQLSLSQCILLLALLPVSLVSNAPAQPTRYKAMNENNDFIKTPK